MTRIQALRGSMAALCLASAHVLAGCHSGGAGRADFGASDPRVGAGTDAGPTSEAALASSPEAPGAADALPSDSEASEAASELTEPNTLEEGDGSTPDATDELPASSATSNASEDASLDVEGEAGAREAGASSAALDAATLAPEHSATDAGTAHGTVVSDAATAWQPVTDEAGTLWSPPAVDASSCSVDCECPPNLMGPGCAQLRFIDIAAGKSHTCGLLGDGSVRCWGNDAFGQISSAPTGSDYVAIHSGGVYSCAIRRDDTIYCWGDVAGIVDVPLEPVLSLVTGWDAACAELTVGSYECWGSDANEKYSGRPSEPVLALQIGWQQGCALLQDGSLECWGENDQDQAVPPAGNDFVDLSLASWHGCAQHEDGTLECWGSTTNAPVAPVLSMSSRGLSTCAIMLDQSVRCWGEGGALDPPSELRAQKLAVGDGHACALLQDNSIECWGQSLDGAARAPATP